MAGWATLLDVEATTLFDLRAEEIDEGITLFEKFVPNPGGQTLFCEATKFDRIEPLDHRWVALLGGIGSGKTYTGGAWAASRALLDPYSRGLITANTFGQLARSTLVGLVEVCRNYNIPLEPWRDGIEDQALAIANCQRCYIGPDRAFVYVLSMGSFLGKSQAARGIQVRWAWSDEAAYAPEQAFQVLDGRLGRGPGQLKGQGIVTTSPNGYNWVWDRFGDPERDARKKKVYVMFPCPTKENIKYLGEDYILSLETNYTEELAQQELEGLFVNSTVGRIYKYFDRNKHALSGEDAELLRYNPKFPVHLAFDFNHSPACATLSQIRNAEIHTFKEYYLMDADTYELSELIIEWLQEKGHCGEIYVYGDASGFAKSAASRLSNWDIVASYLAQAKLEVHWRVPKKNPLVLTRINSVNCLFRNHRIYVDKAECPELIKDLDSLTWDGTNIDKADKLRSHLSDSLGYLAHTLYPYKAIASYKKTEIAKKKRIIH